MPHDQEQSIIKQYKKLNKPPPKQIRDKPRLEDREELFLYNCFHELSTERYPNSYGISPIPVCKIYEYARNIEVAPSYHQRFVFCMRSLDTHYVKSLNENIRQSRKGK